ncbi:predicted protein [Uncinocarpus reesii 1704]|uniref:Aminoglycoside phosphotransferase domain-containing protein n=1 Tax=Uncinocarpus reesii (strain UAMH 1704) TaxID=336963 RepID=C4JXX5_UNCRE|nr:uncharacterized protein UREG_07026 [Uncinocarpus reesii 1704]EEP82161.1 predicted protein [Uncinocarpus reesii 1704]
MAADRELFTYTSGRYLYNEKLRLAERHIEFNIDALKAIAARCVDRQSVSSMKKLAEGGFNRVFVLTMNDGFEVIVKIPYLLTVPRKLTTESKVATMDYLRLNGIPVPRVYAWSSDASNNVGTEYIIMEKAPGKLLTDCWFELSPKERVNLVTSYVELERKLFSLPLSAYGSLFYKDSLPEDLRIGLPTPQTEDKGFANRFCMGPLSDYMFWRGRHADLDLKRGPCCDHRQYLHDVGQRELEWTQRFGRPLENNFPQNTILPGEISHEIYIDLLKKYLELAPYILPEPPQDPLNKPTLRHPDLNPANIYVSSSCEISCLIDWQYTCALPLLLVAGNPPMFDNPDPEPPKDFSQPSLPPDSDNLSPDEKSQADELHRRRMLFWLYMIFNGRDNKAHLNAIQYPLLMPRQHLVDRAGRQWTGNIITLKGAILRVVQNWDMILGPRAGSIKCPVSFTSKEEEEFYKVEELWFKMNVVAEHYRELLDDLGQDGWVRSESYDKVVALNKTLKQEWVDAAEDEEDRRSIKRWPFQDHEEID